MARGEALTVWLRGEPVGQFVRQRDGRLDLRYAGDAVARLGEGAVGVSVALPVRSRLERVWRAWSPTALIEHLARLWRQSAREAVAPSPTRLPQPSIEAALQDTLF